ncbi:CDP-glycerol glycerophosphotransferase family protein [uncultured Friedmanniella sp.]|uniref:CDP-glycerol glycerophosphotransferase family protein n=1 Tax=uncultured Friedmanniella sp. TaxID=335381 RepID=UPI0035C9EE9C
MPDSRQTSRVSLRGWSSVVGTALSKVVELALANAAQVCSVLAAVLLLAPSGLVGRLLGSLAGLAALGTTGWLLRQAARRPLTPFLGSSAGPRLLLLVAVGAALVARRPDDAGWFWSATGLGLLAVLTETSLRVSLAKTEQVAVNLPGVEPVPEPPFPPRSVVWASVALVLLGAVLAAVAAPGWLYLVLAASALAAVGAQLAAATRANLVATRAATGLRKALERYQPAFVVYYAAVVGARYQLGMWLPYLERMGLPFVVVTRNASTVPTIATLTAAPIVVPRTRGSVGGLDAVVVPTLRAAFYVQGDVRNSHFMRYEQLTHCWLNHGDSDKSANWSPKHAAFDKVFVCGQQGEDRYAAHKVGISPSRFVRAGRPQVERIEVHDAPPPPGRPRTVLYAPTWRGGRPKTNHSSLPVAERIVDGLLEHGATVVFRPHPLSYNEPTDADICRRIHDRLTADGRATGRVHVWGAKAEQEWDIPDCVNAVDALVTDVSSVASDFLASGKPIAMVAIQRRGDAFRKEFAMARVSYLIEKDLSTLESALDDLLEDDPLAEKRRAYRSYCLGDELGEHAAEPFLRAAGRIVGRQK